jgi:stage V sporulation protein G
LENKNYFLLFRRNFGIFGEFILTNKKLQCLIGRWAAKMEITDIRIRKVEAEGKMRAVVSVTFDNEFVVHDIKIIESQGGLFIAMPSRKTPTGEFRDIAHPINADARNKVQNAILEKYQSMLAEEEAAGTSNKE